MTDPAFDETAADVIDEAMRTGGDQALLRGMYWLLHFYPPNAPAPYPELVHEFRQRLANYFTRWKADGSARIQSLDEAFAVDRQRVPWKHTRPDGEGMNVAARVFLAVEEAHDSGHQFLDPSLDPDMKSAYYAAALALEEEGIEIEPPTVREIHSRVRDALQGKSKG